MQFPWDIENIIKTYLVFLDDEKFTLTILNKATFKTTGGEGRGEREEGRIRGRGESERFGGEGSMEGGQQISDRRQHVVDIRILAQTIIEWSHLMIVLDGYQHLGNIQKSTLQLVA